MRCIFLDRDGTICLDKTYNNKIEDLEIIGWSRLTYNLHRIKRLGFYIIVISNQGGVSLGYSTEEEVIKFNNELNRKLNYTIDDFFFCPHAKTDNCDCRKPKTGLIELALKKYKIDTELSWFIGDKAIDIETGKNIGAKTILVLTGHGRNELKNSDPDFVAEDINQALLIIEKITTETNKDIEIIYGKSNGIKLQGVIDNRVKGKYSKMFEKIKIDSNDIEDFVIEHNLPVDFILGTREN